MRPQWLRWHHVAAQGPQELMNANRVPLHCGTRADGHSSQHVSMCVEAQGSQDLVIILVVSGVGSSAAYGAGRRCLLKLLFLVLRGL